MKYCGACDRPMAASDRHLLCQKCRVAGRYSVTRRSTRQQAQPDDLSTEAIERRLAVLDARAKRLRQGWRAA